MKIEIGESLMLSWLRHAKNCQVVQLNWKPSVKSWQLNNKDIVEAIMRESESYFRDKYGLNLFKKNSSFGQLLQQGEIDVLGIEFNGSRSKNVYGIDIAFHENGLSYGSKEETVARIIKKMVRTAMNLQGYFNLSNGEIIFASPKVHHNIISLLRECIQDLNDHTRMLGMDYHFSLICNEDFRDQIFNVVTSLSTSVADTSELFMRSIQMYNLFVDAPIAFKAAKEQKERHYNIDDNSQAGLDEIKIGILMKTTMTRFAESNTLSSIEVERLQNAEYSKRTFNVNYPVLKPYNRDLTMSHQRNINGYPRYYKELYNFDGGQYLLCNHWVEDLSRSYFQAWLKSLEN